jgi:hypothetical protein
MNNIFIPECVTYQDMSNECYKSVMLNNLCLILGILLLTTIVAYIYTKVKQKKVM